METAECACHIYRTSGCYRLHILSSFFLVRVHCTHVGPVSIGSGHYCSDVILLAVNISDDYRHVAKSGNNGEWEVFTVKKYYVQVTVTLFFQRSFEIQMAQSVAQE